MPIRRGLLGEIAAALTPALTSNLSGTSHGDDLYEAYIWAILVKAARAKNASVVFKDVDGNVVSGNFVFRTSPGQIWWNSHPYSHAEIALPVPRCPSLEAHVGVYVGGKSATRHECDVALIEKAEAQICRRDHVLPRCRKVILAVEGKFYIQSRVGIQYARAFLGLRAEIEKKHRFFLATSASTSVEKILARHAPREHDLTFSPAHQRKVDQIQGAFEQVIGAYMAAHR